MLGVIEDLARGVELHHLTRVHDGQAIRKVRHDAHVVGDKQDGKAQLVTQRLDLSHEGSLGHDVERRRGLIHNDQFGLEQQGHGNHRALAHAARQLEGEALEVNTVDRDHRQNFFGALRDPMVVPVGVRSTRVGQLGADRECGVKGVHRTLHHHRDVAPAVPAKLLIGKRAQVHPVEGDRPSDNARRIGQQLRDGEEKRGLATARLTHDGEKLALG